jgi:hypothetical protein
MTLNRARPATINSIKLFAMALFAIGIAVFAYLSAERGTLARPPVTSTIAWTGGLVLLALDAGKRRAEKTPEQVAPEVSHKIPPHSSLHREIRRKSNHPSHTSSVAEYTHQISHF